MKNFYFLVLCLISFYGYGQIETFNWPTESGQAILSDKYEVYVRNGNDAEIQLEVLMSNADFEGDFRAAELEGRTFSFVNLNYDVGAGSGLTFRVVKLFGEDSNSVEIQPRSYGIQHSMVNGTEITFSIDDNSKYMSVNFQGDDNVTSPNNWIVHMLGIFIDPPESAASFSCAAEAITYRPDMPVDSLINADAIEFPAGYHNLRNYENKGAGFIDENGVLTLRDEQELYIAGGAFVEALIVRDKYQDKNQKIYGRGILSGRQFVWQGNPNSDGTRWGQIIIFGFDPVIEGITVLDSPNHGIVSPENAKISNLKYLGWHANNDGIRVGSKSEIKDSFLRCVDDHFYNWNIYVHDCVLWAGHNGAILTYGWSDIATGSSLLENIDVIHPEWIGRGNNNGLTASQVALNFTIKDYGADSQSGSMATILRNIRVDGNVAALANIKPRSGGIGEITAERTTESEVGYIGELLMENIRVDGQVQKSRLEGVLDATTDGDSPFLAKNLTFTDITIGGTRLTEENKLLFFDIDEESTENLVFDEAVEGGANAETQVEDFIAPIIAVVENETPSAVMAALPAGTGSWFTVNSGEIDWQVKPTEGNPNEHLTRMTDNKFAKGAAYVFNNTNKTSGGIMELSFDYFYSTAADSDRMSYRVYGVKDPEGNGPDGVIKMTGGSGGFGDNFASEYDGSDGEQLYVDNAMAQTDDWTTLNYGTVDLTEYEFLVITFAVAFNNSDATDPSAIMGIDNVVVPKNREFFETAETQIEDFVSPIITVVDTETTATNILAIPENMGQWFTVNSGAVDWQVLPTDGNPDAHLTRNNGNKFAKGAAYVFNNVNGVSGGLMDLSFDYFYSTAAEPDRMSYRVYGVTDPEGDGPNGVIKMTGGSGGFGDNFASEYNGSDAVQFYVDNALAQTDEWTTLNYGAVDLSGFEYLIITFAVAFNNSDVSDFTGIMGIDNVVVPKNLDNSSGKSVRVSKNKTATFYANPASENFGISIMDGSSSYNYEILDNSGRTIVPQTNGTGQMINVSQLKSGLYFVRVSTPNGTTVGKMIKR